MNSQTRQLELLVKVLHHLTKHFKEHAILKGGMELALFSSPRSTNDLDFVFVPFESKKDIVKDVEKSLKAIANNIAVKTQLSSKNAKFLVTDGDLGCEIEINVATEMESIPMNTAVLSKLFNIAPQVIRVMKPEVALAHKIAAWNEWRLIRDLYDIYFWFSIQKILPDMHVLEKRLQNIESRVEKFRKRKKMTLHQLCDELSEFCKNLSQDDIDQGLPNLPSNERQHLDKILGSQMNVLVNRLHLTKKGPISAKGKM